MGRHDADEICSMLGKVAMEAMNKLAYYADRVACRNYKLREPTIIWTKPGEHLWQYITGIGSVGGI